MCSICGQKEPPDTETFGETLMDPVGTYVHDLVFVRIGSARKECLEFHGLAGDQLFSRQAGNFSVCDTEEAIRLDFGHHAPVFGVDDKVGVAPVVRAHVVVDLHVK